MKNYQLNLKVDPKVTPVVQPMRRIPFHSQQRVLKTLQELVDLDVTERLTERSQWVNLLVTEVKKN